ncbi:MAG: FAD-binding protein, partial [Lentisphaeraceae bacterium]|nr:FAD-binding protein [Lentisphaeraceae bacterium]
HSLIHSSGRTLNASERNWISKLADEIDCEIEKLSTDFPEQRIGHLKTCLEKSIQNIKEFIEIERFFWLDAELQIMKQHALSQLGYNNILPESILPEPVQNPAEDAASHFVLAKLHHIKESGLDSDDLNLIKDWISSSNDQNEKQIIHSLSKVDLGLTAIYFNCRMAQKITESDKFISLMVSEDIEEKDNCLTGKVTFALSAIANEYLLVSKNGAWIVDPKAEGFKQETIGTIGLRMGAPVEITLDNVKAEKVDFSGIAELIEKGIELYYESVIGAGEYLLEKSINHATGRIQFPDLFQDEHGRDGIIKFGAVKALIAHIACRLELLKAAQDSDIPATVKYVQAGKWLGTQEGSFTYNATQVFGGTGFSEDDTLSPYYRDASIFKYLLGDPFKVQTDTELTFDFSTANFEENSLLNEPLEWLNKALDADKTVNTQHKAIYFRSVSDYLFIQEILKEFVKAEKEKKDLLYLEQIIDMASKIYWNSALSRAHDSSMYESRKDIGARLHKEEWKVLKPADRTFDYDAFLEEIPAKPTGEFLVNPDFDSPRYSPENRASDPALAEKAKELNAHFKSYFIDKDFDGKSYCRYAEEMHGHSDEVIKMFHDKGYMRLIIPKELGGEGCHKSIYYLLISASMQYGDPALSLIIQASTSIGTSPMLLAWKKDIPKAIKDAENLNKEKGKMEGWVYTCGELIKTLENPDPATIKKLFQSMGDQVKALAGKNSVFKSQCTSFLYGLHKAGQAGMSFQLDVMGAELKKAADKLSEFIPTIDAMEAEFKSRKKGVGFFLSMIASGQTSAFALTEPSAGSDTARVATRATVKQVDLTRDQNGSYSFNKEDGETRILIDLEQTRFEEGVLQIRLKDEDDWSDVKYDKYSWADDTGYRYFNLNGEEFIFHEFGRVLNENDKPVYRYFELTGSKMWITNGRFAGLFALYAKTEEGITGLCVDRYVEGLTIGKDEDKMGQNASPTNEVFLEKVRVCTSFVLGLEGRGQVNALETLNVGRAGLSLSSLALTEDMIEAAVNFSKGSENDNVLVGQMMEEMSGAFPASYEMIGIFDTKGSDARMESAIGKFMNSEILHRSILYSEGIHSANSQTFKYDVEKKKRDARILNIYEGTNEIQRFLILKDLIEQLSKKEYGPIATSKSSKELKHWDQLRKLLLDMVKKVKKDIGSKAWMDSQLQPIFFYLSEVAGWLNFTGGAIWRLLDIESDKNHVIYAALEASVKRGIFETNKRFQLFDHAYAMLSKGVRPPEIVLPGLLLDEIDETSESTSLSSDNPNTNIKVQAFLATRPLNRPETEIIKGFNVDDSSILTSGSLKLFNRIKTLPKSVEVEIVCAAPQNAQSLILHLSSVAKVKWINTNEKWPSADSCAQLWKKHLKVDHYLLFDGSSPAWMGAASYLASSLKIKTAFADEFSFNGKNSLTVLKDAKSSSIDSCTALITSQSFKYPDSVSQRCSGTIESAEKFEVEIISASLPPEPEKVEDAVVKDPETAAGYLSKELGIEQSDTEFLFEEMSDSTVTGVSLVGSIKAGEISRDTITSLNSLLSEYKDLTLILPGAKGLNNEILSKCSTLPEKVIMLDFPESWLQDSSLTVSCLEEILGETEQTVFFAPGRASEAGILADDKNQVLKTSITKVSPKDGTCQVWTEEAEGSVIIQTEVGGHFVGLMSTNAESSRNTSINTKAGICRIEAKGSAEFDLIKKSLASSADKLGIESISDAEFIIDIGYGIGNQDNYDEFIQPLVDTLTELGVKVSIGASRKLVETLKILPPETQIGQSGSSVSPKILIAIGISGAPQHINYIGKNTIILCFNIDPQATLMVLNESKPFPKVYPIAGDLKKTIPALKKALESLLHSSSAA